MQQEKCQHEHEHTHIEGDEIHVKKQWFIQQKTQRLEELYDIKTQKLLGSGAFGQAFSIKLRGGDQYRAVKMIPKARVKNPKELINEINTMKNLDHPNLIKLFEVFEDSRNIFLVMEQCDGGELFDHIVEGDGAHLTEKRTRHLFRMIASAVAYCHAHNICHRDLKPENCLLLTKEPDSPVKVIDFGLSCAYIDQDRKVDLTQTAGSPYYMAPEILIGHYTEKCDVWSLGVMLYIMLTGIPPFYGNTDPAIYSMIRKGKYNLNLKQFEQVSPHAIDLIKRCLVPEAQRLTAQELLQHEWMSQELPEVTLTLQLDSLRNFASSNRLKRLAISYIASQLSETEIYKLGEQFRNLDTNGDGVLSLEEILNGMKDSLDQNGRAELEQIFKRLDTDGSGTIDYNEFIAMSIDQGIYLKQDKLYMAFKLLDVDGSGKISKDELKKVLGADSCFSDIDDSYWESMIQEADANGDGEIDYSEFTQLMKGLAKGSKAQAITP